MKQLHTRFSESMDPRQVLPEYPRPMLVRKSYYNLNGLWEYAVACGSGNPSAAIPAGRPAELSRLAKSPAVVSRRTESPATVSLPAESSAVVSRPAESPATVSRPAESPATVSRPPESPAAGPEEYDGRILVPFSPECALSGVNRKILPEHVLWYRRTLPSVPLQDGERLLLHFGAVDQHAWIYVNGICVGEHHGGYLPFTCDITEALRSRAKHCAGSMTPAGAGPDDILTVKAVDLTDTSYHSRGKQKLEPSGMYYTAQSGIWQTVWMEAAPENFIERIAFRPDYDGSKIRMKLYSETDETVTYTIYSPCIDLDASANPGSVPMDPISHGNIAAADLQTKEAAPAAAASAVSHEPQILLTGRAVTNHAFSVSLPDFKAWSPEEPYLYYVTFETARDRVQSYFAMRKCDLQSGADGVPRIYLNNRPYFQTGLLDQGYYPESLYTPPADAAMTADILSAKALGFNMLRKHAKIEPDRFYYHCDRLGMLVWQDMVNGGSAYKDWYVTYLATAMNQLHIRPGDRFRRLLSRREKAGRDEFTAEVRDTVRTLGSHPSIVVWVPFNEGWGQFDTLNICSLIKKLDPDRLVDHASGWFDLGGGDIQSIHYYFFRYSFKPERRRAMALTEYGGYSWSVPGHCTHDEEYGYQKYSDSDSLTEAFQRLIADTILPSVREGLAAAIYTQLTDIESETNGLYTYDRQICKMDAETVRECNRMMKDAGAYLP